VRLEKEHVESDPGAAPKSALLTAFKELIEFFFIDGHKLPLSFIGK